MKSARTLVGRVEGKKTGGRGAAKEAAGSVELSFGVLPKLLGYHLRRTQMAVFKHFADTVAAVEAVTPGLFGMLQVIAANPGLSQSRLAEAMGVDRSTIVKVVRQLEGRGLIERIASQQDRRSKRLYPTARGQTAVRRMERDIRRHEQDIAGGLSGEEQKTLIRLLSRLYERTQRVEAEPRPAVDFVTDEDKASLRRG